MQKRVAVFVLSVIVLAFFGLNSASGEHGRHWSYEGESGPAHWAEMSPEYSLCGKGMSQSPIDLDRTYRSQLDEIRFDYKSTPLTMINNGHTVQVNYGPGSSITVDSGTYDLVQFHFHTPSEYTVKGKHYDMEMHLVHKNKNNELAVVGVFIKQGNANSALQSLVENLPSEVNKETPAGAVSVNASNLLPKDLGYYHLFGSLTTPPCSEGVNWSIMRTPIEASKEQIERFTAIMGHNNRPVQPVNKRFILGTK